MRTDRKSKIILTLLISILIFACEQPELHESKKTTDQENKYDTLKVGDIVKYPTISHRIGGGSLHDNSIDSVKLIADIIKENPDLIFEISYHTDHRGAARGNLKLSENTADFLVHYLIDNNNIAPERIQAKGYGESSPIVPLSEIESADDADKERLIAMNRRFELKVFGKITDDSTGNCDCTAIAYIIKSAQNEIKLYNQEKEVIKRVSFDEENEEFIRIELKDFNDEMFQVSSLTNPFDDSIDTTSEYSNLLIEKQHLNVFLPDRKGKVNLYSKPDENSAIISEVPTGVAYSVQPVKCCNDWIYGIYFSEKGEQLEGWFHPDDICSSPITNC